MHTRACTHKSVPVHVVDAPDIRWLEIHNQQFEEDQEEDTSDEVAPHHTARTSCQSRDAFEKILAVVSRWCPVDQTTINFKLEYLVQGESV